MSVNFSNNFVSFYGSPAVAMQSAAEAQHEYTQMRSRARFKQLWNRLTRKSENLHDLGRDMARCAEVGGHYAGVPTVQLRKIYGSEGRNLDFDREFNPRHDGTQQRWKGIYTAWQNGVVLPPVELIQVGEGYYVRDGHHRISVARALGHEYIDAVVYDLTLGACEIR